MSDDFTLAELVIVACAEAFRGNGEVLASGIGTLPRLGASLAKLTHSPELMMTDGEAFLVEDPVALGPRAAAPPLSGYMSYARVFDIVWSGRRHVMIGPLQIDRWGQANLSGVGAYAKPKIAMLGMRGLPGNSANHLNSMFVPNHSPRVFVEGEVDIVGGVGYNPARWQPGMNRDAVDIRRVVTDLCVLDFEGPDHAVRVRSLHPGVSFEEVQAATGFPLIRPDDLGETAAPSAEALDVIAKLDPRGARAAVFKDNPPGRRV
jgi:glutaconate CoA-transferase, subunit B